MSKLSPALKAAINAPFARSNTIAAPKGIRDVYRRIQEEADAKKVGLMAWMTISAAATTTLNSPASLLELHTQCVSSNPSIPSLHIAEQLREIGLKCLPFNGIPRTINVLTAFRSGLPDTLQKDLSTATRRRVTSSNLKYKVRGGHGLWDSIYAPYETKLIEKLTEAHPDLPKVILFGGYCLVLADPTSPPGIQNEFQIGRVLTSLVAVACLRAQTGVGPQVTSHLFGLRKAYEEGEGKGARAERELPVEGGEWLASDEGNLWVLNVVDQIVEAMGGSNFASGFADIKAKL